MRAVVGSRPWIAAEVRRAGAALAGLAIVLGVFGAAALTTLAGARRTDTAFERAAAASRGPDGFVNLQGLGPEGAARIGEVAGVPGVRALAPFAVMGAALTTAAEDPFVDTVTFVGTDHRLGSTVAVPRVLEGRRADPDNAHEVVVNDVLASRDHLRPGARARFVSLAPGQFEEVTGDAFPEPRGPVIDVVVTGIVRGPLEFINAGQPAAYATAAFYRRYHDAIAKSDGIAMVALDEGAPPERVAADVRRLFGDNPDVIVSPGGLGAAAGTGAAGAVQIQVTGLVAFAATFSLVGFVVCLQAIGRHVRRAADDQPTLAALGLTRTDRTILIVLSVGPALVAAVALALGGAVAGSRWMPVGLAGRAEPDPGVDSDWTILLPGAAALLAVTTAGALIAAWRTAAHTSLDQRRVPASAQKVWFRTFPIHPPAFLGARTALGGAPGRAPVFAGTVLGIAGVVAALVFGANLARLIASPSRFGWNWDAELAERAPTSSAAARLTASREVAADPAVIESALAAYTDGVTIGDASIPAFGLQPVNGTLGYSLVEGRQPRRPQEVVVGQAVARGLHTAIGRTVTAQGANDEPVVLEVVGQALFPVIADNDFNFSVGLTLTGLEQLARAEPAYRHLVRFAPGADADSALQRLSQHGEPHTPGEPNEIHNLRGVQRYPYVLAGALAVLAAAALAHALLSGTRQRRRDFAVLRCLGLTRRDVRSLLAGWAITVMVVSLFAGALLGAVGGGRAWVLLGHSLGVAVDVTIPTIAILVTGLAALIVVSGLAIVLAGRALRSGAALGLRVE